MDKYGDCELRPFADVQSTAFLYYTLEIILRSAKAKTSKGKSRKESAED